MSAGAASPPDQPQAEQDPFRPQSDRDVARATAAVGVLGGQPTGTLQLLGDVKLREFFNDGGKVRRGLGLRDPPSGYRPPSCLPASVRVDRSPDVSQQTMCHSCVAAA